MPKIKNIESRLMHQIDVPDELQPLIGDPAARLDSQDLFFEQNLGP